MCDKKKGIILMTCTGIIFVMVALVLCLTMQPDAMLKDNDTEIKTEVPPIEEEAVVEEDDWESDEGVENAVGENIPTRIPNHVTFSNEEVLYSGFPQDRIKDVKERFIRFIDEGMFEGIGEVFILPETVYYDGEDKFGMIINLNNAEYTYVSIDYDKSKKYTIMADDYTEPPKLLTEDIMYARKREADYEVVAENKDVMKELSDIVSDYYSYVSKRNYYVGYEKYKEGADYYYKNVDQFRYEYSTYKAHNMQLLEEIAGGNKELLEQGQLDAEVLGYIDVKNTDYYIVKVKLTLSNKKVSAETTKWVTVFSYMEGDCIFPEDTLLMDTWVYIYRY